jgi:hypothetical protein
MLKDCIIFLVNIVFTVGDTIEGCQVLLDFSIQGKLSAKKDEEAAPTHNQAHQKLDE